MAVLCFLCLTLAPKLILEIVKRVFKCLIPLLQVRQSIFFLLAQASLFVAAEPVYASDVPQPKVVVVTQPLPQVRAPVKFGEHPVDMVCSNCQNTVK